MAVWVSEVDPAPTVPGIDLVTVPPTRICPIRKVSLADAGKDLVEFYLGHQESVVLGRNLSGLAHVFLDIHIV
jgi:hypothetical protein